ncbi:MAG: PKD domain-containing protein, partial [Thermoplasmata archaeon]|nr:PKD domain-containing protein [Thermoplasmata archaeon]
STVTYGISVSTGSPTVIQNVVVNAQVPPANYSTVINFSAAFNQISVTSTGTLANDSTFPELPNASVGQLWAQLGLDLAHTITFDGTNSALTGALTSWLNSSGPFFPAAQAGFELNGTTFGPATNAVMSPVTIPSSVLGLTSSSGLTLGWSQKFNSTSALPNGGAGHTYTISFNFKHPVGAESVNYTVDLPAGYALAADTQKPTSTDFVPQGPGGTWTKFTMVSKAVAPGQPVWGNANLTVVKYSGITAIVNASVANFAFSQLNVVNSTRNNYTVVVGQGQNVTFSAENSTFPDGTNGTAYNWDFGDGSYQNISQSIGYHTFTSTGAFAGSVWVTSSGGSKSQANFTVWVGSEDPRASITSNASAAEKKTVNDAPYLLVNWSTTLQFNVTNSSAPLYSGATSTGVLSDAAWTLSLYEYNKTWNFTASAGVNVNSNVTYIFSGAGHYLANGIVAGTAVPLNGWQYNLTLVLWDGQGHKTTATLPILVRDTQKPVSVVTLQSANGDNITSSGVVEAANHTSYVAFLSQYSYDPQNGSVVTFYWHITDSGNSSVNLDRNQSATAPTYKNPGKWTDYLSPQVDPYTVNLTITDRAGNTAYQTAQLTVTVNTSTRPVLSVTNLTAPTTMAGGSTYTIWANVTNTVGKNSTANDVSVAFYFLQPDGTGSPIYLQPASAVKFFGYTSGVVNSTAADVGSVPTLAYNTTLRAEITFSPGRTGSYSLYVNATATNEFAGNYGPNVASLLVTLNPNPIVQYEIDAAIIAIAIVLIVVVVLVLRRGKGGGMPFGKSKSSSSQDKGSSKKDDKKSDDDE